MQTLAKCAIAPLLFMLACCSSVDQREVREAFYKADYKRAAELSGDFASSVDSESRSLALLDAGLILAASAYNYDSGMYLSEFLNSRSNSEGYLPSDTEYMAASYSLALSALALGDKDAAKGALNFARDIAKHSPEELVQRNAENLKKLLKRDVSGFSPSALLGKQNADFTRQVSALYKVDNIWISESAQLAAIKKALDLPLIPLLEGIVALSDLKAVQDVDSARSKFAEAAGKMPSNIFLQRNLEMLDLAKRNGFVPNMTFVFYESGLGGILQSEELHSYIYVGGGSRLCADLFDFKIYKFSRDFGNDLSILADGKFYRPLLISDFDASKRLEEVANLPFYVASRVLECEEACEAGEAPPKLDLRSSMAMPVSVYYASLNTPKDRKLFIDGLKVNLEDAPINIVRVRRTASGSVCSVQVFCFK